MILQNSITDESLNDITNPILKNTVKKKSSGRPSIPLLECSPQAQRDKLKDEYRCLKTTSEKENCPFNMLLGILGRRYYHNIDAPLEKLFSLIANGVNPMEGRIIDEQRCLQIREDLGIGQPLWDALRNALLPGVVLTSRYRLQNYAKEQYPHFVKK